MDWNDWKTKKVYVEVNTSNGVRVYSGIVNDIVYLGKSIDKVENFFIEIIDKFNDKVGFSSSSIKIIKEEK